MQHTSAVHELDENGDATIYAWTRIMKIERERLAYHAVSSSPRHGESLGCLRLTARVRPRWRFDQERSGHHRNYLRNDRPRVGGQVIQTGRGQTTVRQAVKVGVSTPLVLRALKSRSRSIQFPVCSKSTFSPLTRSWDLIANTMLLAGSLRGVITVGGRDWRWVTTK